MKEFSVLISIYCKENPVWLHEAFDSLFSQTVTPNEIVLVKDGPLTPELDAVINEFAERYPFFNIVQNETNLGLGLALQKGVLACSNEIIARMDTDDIIPKDRFEKQLAKIEEGYDVVSCWSQLFIGEQDNVVAVKTRPEKHEDIVKLAHRRSPVCHAACMLRKSAVLKAGNYMNCPLYEDYHLWIRMIMSGAKFYNIQEVLYFVRTTEDQAKRRSGYKYLKTEMAFFKEFYKKGFFSTGEYLKNVMIRTVVRLAPSPIRFVLFTKIWNHK